MTDNGTTTPVEVVSRGTGWVLAIAALSLAACIAVAFDLAAPWRPILAIAFVSACPGMALVRHVRLGGPLIEAMLAVALSLSLAGIVAGALLYLGAWSPIATFAILIGITSGALLMDPAVPRRRAWLVLRAATSAAAAASRDPEGATSGAASLGGAAATVGEAAGRRSGDLPQAGRASGERPPPPLAVVRRRSAIPAAPSRRSSGRRRAVLGEDPLADHALTGDLRATLDQVVDALADEREGRRT